MKALLKTLYLLLVLVILVLLAGIFLPKEFRIASSVNINAPDELIFNQLNDLKNQELWSPWQFADSTIKVTYGQLTSGEGAYYTTTSENSGSIKLTIVESVPVNKLTMELDFGDKGEATIYWNLEVEGRFTKLTLEFENSRISYFERYFAIMFKNNMVHTFNLSLNKIKAIAEDLRLSRISDIKIVTLEKQPAMVITDSCKLEEMGERMEEMYGRISAYMKRRDLEAEGPPFAIYYSWNPEGISKFACGIPIEKMTWGWKDYNVIELPGGEAATVVHWGKYDSGKPYLALDNYLQKKEIEREDYIWEVYINDPANEPDTSLWQKQIFYPLKQME